MPIPSHAVQLNFTSGQPPYPCLKVASGLGLGCQVLRGGSRIGAWMGVTDKMPMCGFEVPRTGSLDLSLPSRITQGCLSSYVPQTLSVMQANMVLDRRPGIQRIDQGSLLRILQLSTSLERDTRIEDIQGELPRGYLGLVSRSLDRFIVNEPSLWTTFVIHPDSAVETYTVEGDPTSNILTRSADLPLSIYLLPGRLGDGADRRMKREVAAARLLGEIIAKEGARIKTLVVSTRWRSSLRLIGNLLDPQPLPLVERLVIESAIDDVGAPDIGLVTHLDDPARLTSLSIDAVNLFAFLVSTHDPHSVLALITSLTLTNMHLGTYGFPEDGLSSIIELIDSLLYLQSLTFDDFQMLEHHLEKFGIVQPRTPTQLHNLTLRNTSGSARTFLRRHISPTTLVIEQ
ncbi:hypothetical protein DFP72DRAFT_857112 [Ephemerocybe angulata]|uniref:Uncharacterized protein n=1 Tax=Ephemerocybe angulata TaxID=980116 RepID=A0A8H6HDD1_9AGAR|nr:hypothetical protein DFP72DRAFT_857112 [Tulosesus angulatus]